MSEERIQCAIHLDCIANWKWNLGAVSSLCLEVQLFFQRLIPIPLMFDRDQDAAQQLEAAGPGAELARNRVSK
ncbi:hypothetical protein A1351_06530 [Methylosinus sp. R-45379]|nr:hypothetical protein A1351_06530 [Methylosinus sp. R-45379]